MAVRVHFENQATALPAATATDCVPAAFGTGGHLSVHGISRLAVTIKNTGGNPITAIVISWGDSFDGTRETADGSVTIPGGTLAAGATVRYLFTDMVAKTMRIQITSTLGSTATLDLEGRDASGAI